MTIKIEEEKELLTVNPREAPPSQRRNEDVDPVKREDEEDKNDDREIFATDGQLIFAPSLSDHGVFLMLNHTVLDSRVLVQAIEQAEEAYWLDDDHPAQVDVVDESELDQTSYTKEDYCDDCNDPSCLSSSVDIYVQRRSVRFTEKLVTEIRYRPRTLPEDLRTLFYTYEETQRFRQEYRLERRIVERMDEELDEFTSEDTILVQPTEPHGSPVDEDPLNLKQDETYLSQAPHNKVDICIEANEQKQLNDDIPSCCSLLSQQFKCKYDISRVVVMHNDTLKTYDDTAQQVCSNDVLPIGNKKLKTSTEDFFDNDSFWSGSITWY